MKKSKFIMLFLIVLIAAGGCNSKKSEGDIIATIGDYSLYKKDFLAEAELYPDAYRNEVTKEELLSNLIQKKVLLMEAQREKLDKEPEFTKTIQRFWEQSLLKVMLEKKSKEILSSMPASDGDRTQKAGKLIKEWFDGLEKNTKVRVNKKALEGMDPSL
ncbi:MAG: hypothetical protein V1933_02530 [Candidatus Omnitrophota bacterium]